MVNIGRQNIGYTRSRNLWKFLTYIVRGCIFKGHVAKEACLVLRCIGLVQIMYKKRKYLYKKESRGLSLVDAFLLETSLVEANLYNQGTLDIAKQASIQSRLFLCFLSDKQNLLTGKNIVILDRYCKNLYIINSLRP